MADLINVLKELLIFALGAVGVVALAFSGLGIAVWIGHIRERRRPSSNSDTAAANRLLARLKRAARPTLLLVPAKSPGFSKLGGDPELPPDIRWPGEPEAPRTFLAQIDIGAFQSHVPMDWLPAEGRLFFFYDEGYGAADQVKVVYSVDDPGPTKPPPAGIERHGERRVAFMPFVSFPSAEWLRIEDELGIDFEALDARLDAVGERPPGEELLHRIGGYPDEIQNGCLRLEAEHLARGLPPLDYAAETPPAIERASKEWRLLVQIDSDPELGMEFADAGRFYVFIRERHARASDFAKTVTLFQCY
jgi:uncharacterized protein YwqG